MIPESTQRMGLIPTIRTFFFGERAARLTERANRSHWLSYLLIVSQSVAVVLVFGHAEVPLLLASSLAIRALALMVLFVLIITVIAADIALLETLSRIPALARNRQRGLMWEHVWYVLFVLATEGSTYAVVLAAIDSDPQVLVRSAPLIPTVGVIFVTLVILRVLLICWSAVQLIIVRGKLPVLLSTLTNTGKEIVGAHVERQLAAVDITGVTLPDTFRLYAAMARPPRRIRGLFNGWLVERDLKAEAEEERQVRNVVEALEELERRRVKAPPAPVYESPDDEPPMPPRGGVPQPAPAAPVADLNPIAAQEVRTIVQSLPEAMPVARSLSIMRNAATGRRRNAPGRRTTSGKRDTSSVKEIVEAVWHPGISLSEIQAATVTPSRPTGISRGAASKWNKFFEATHPGSAESA